MGASTGQGFYAQWRQGSGAVAWNVAANYVADGSEGADSDSTKGMFGSAEMAS